MSNSVLMMLPDRISSGGKDHIFTPQEVASDMVDTVPEKVFVHDSTFCDTCCKSGVFLENIYNKLMDSPDLIREKPNRYKRHKHILENQLFGISPTKECQALSIRTVYGDINVKNNIICLGDKYLDIMKNKDRRFLYEILEKEFGRMKFNVVALNPPYNKGMDIDFVNTAYDLSTDYVIAITPAKWQTAEADQRIASNMSYGEFRKKIVPHMSYVCFYPDCKDLFNIMQTDGITWYFLDKSKKKQDTCEVVNKCSSIQWYNSAKNRSITERQPLLNIGNEIVEYIKNKKIDFKFDMCNNNGRYRVYTTDQMSGGGLYAITKSNPAVHYLGISTIYDTAQPNWYKELNNVHKEVFRSNNIEECESFISWIQSKFIRFFIAINVNRMTGVVNNDTFRLVPAPTSGKFDHIYTDEELYKTFNLPQEYIDVIEAVIKERK